MQKKFSHLQVEAASGAGSFHRAVARMRDHTAREEAHRERRERSLVTHLAWYVRERERER